MGLADPSIITWTDTRRVLIPDYFSALMCYPQLPAQWVILSQPWFCLADFGIRKEKPHGSSTYEYILMEAGRTVAKFRVCMEGM